MKLFAIIFAVLLAVGCYPAHAEDMHCLGTIQTIAATYGQLPTRGGGRDLLLLQSGDSFKSSEHGPGTTPTYDGLRSQRKLVQSEALRWPVAVTFLVPQRHCCRATRHCLTLST